MALSEGQMLGPYRIEAPMGQGGMATIYRATQQRLGRVVAIKMLHPVFLQDATFLSRFEREAQIVARLDHPHIVPVYDFSDYNGQPYLVMKYIDGTTLKMAQADGPLPPAEILRLLTPIADALDYAHRQGVLHRDVKPSNILIAGDGTPWLTDFGLARMAALGSSTLSGDMMLGTPHYISPEQALGSQNLTAATDLYSFGVVLYELATGRVPFSGDTPYAIVHAHIYDPLPAPRSINPELSAAIEAVLVKALSKEPAQRYATASALVAAYRAALAVPAPAAPSAQSEPAPETEALLGGMDPFDALAGTVTLPPDAATASSFGSIPAAAPVEGVKPKRTVIETSFDLSDVGESLRAAGESLKETFEGMAEGGSEADDDIAAPGDDAALRRRVERQIKKKNGLWKNLLAYVVVIPIMWMIYGFSSGIVGPDATLPLALTQFPWPAIVMLGWAAGLAGDAIETYHRTGARAARRIARLHEAFRAEYGPQWYRNAPRKELKSIRKRLDKPYKKRIDFYKNIANFSFIIPMLWVIYGFSSRFITAEITGGDPAVAITSFPWPLIVMFFWGMNIVSDGLSVRSTARTESAVEREMERQRSMADPAEWPDEKAKNDTREDGTRIGEDGELTDSLAREIEREINRGRR
ncbi:MAG: protein kinase [Anaerolineae bacterium]|nr:protein kinase [Anaerolineae bacterium]